MSKYVKYEIRRQNDGSYVVLEKDLVKKKLTIHSHHDSLEEAQDELTDLSHRPSQAEVLSFLKDLRSDFKNKTK